MVWDGIVGACRLLLTLDPAVMQAAGRTLLTSTLAVLSATAIGVLIGVGLARVQFYGRGVIVFLFRTGMGIPTVLIGVLGFVVLSRHGPLGDLDLLYTLWGIALGEFLLALPIVVTLVHGAIRTLDSRVFETAMMLGASRLRRLLTYLSETRLQVALAVLTAFARCSTELGIAILIGGNLRHTQTLATLTREELRQGEFARGIATSLILLALALGTTACIAWLGRTERDR